MGDGWWCWITTVIARYWVKPTDFVIDDVLVILYVFVWFDDSFLPGPGNTLAEMRHFKRKESTVNNFNSNYFKVKTFGRHLEGWGDWWGITFGSICFLGISVATYSTVLILVADSMSGCCPYFSRFPLVISWKMLFSSDFLIWINSMELETSLIVISW